VINAFDAVGHNGLYKNGLARQPQQLDSSLTLRAVLPKEKECRDTVVNAIKMTDS
jgi:hypothetical protein